MEKPYIDMDAGECDSCTLKDTGMCIECLTLSILNLNQLLLHEQNDELGEEYYLQESTLEYLLHDQACEMHHCD
jgi:hypothetical protein